MIFKRGYKINKLYVARLGRVTKEEFIEGKHFLDNDIIYHIDIDGPVAIFTIKRDVAKRISTGVDYYYFDGMQYPRTYEWFVRNATPLTQIYNFKDGVKAISLKEIKAIEADLNKKYANKEQDESEKQQ